MDYAEYASRKYSVAVALAVMKSKPPGVPTALYVSQLQNQISTCQDNIDQISILSLDFQDDTIEDIAATPVQCGQLQDVPVNNTDIDVHHENTPQTCGFSHDPRNLESQNSTSILNGYEKYGNVYFDNQECGQRIDEGQKIRNKDQFNTTVDQSVERHKECTDGQENDTGIGEENTDVFTQTLDRIFFGQTYSEEQGQTSMDIENVKNQLENTKISQTTLPKHHLPGNEMLSCKNTEIQNVHLHDQDTDLFSQNTQDLLHYNNLNEKSFISAVTLQGKNTEIPPRSEIENPTSMTMESQKEILKTRDQQNPEELEFQTQSQSKNTQIEICITMLSQALSEPEIEDVTLLEIDKNESKGVPFKIIMELNKVKHVLSQIDDVNLSARNSNSDSGYTSGSQLSTSQKFSNTALLSDCKLNQASHTILDYLAGCSASTLHHPMTADMADALGRLVDVLHRRGTYPSFLDTLLERVELVLKETCGSSEHSKVFHFAEKEESLQRLSLLTNSKEITSFAIDKLLDSLESFHRRFTKEPDATYEAHNVSDIENQCYAFHLLETLIVKYLSKKEGESDVETQEETVEELTPTPKDLPSSIADIWRQRWDPNYAPPAVEAPRKPQRKVLKRCAAVLNKFVVGCMDGYSLISYAALECYNSLQH